MKNGSQQNKKYHQLTTNTEKKADNQNSLKRFSPKVALLIPMFLSVWFSK